MSFFCRKLKISLLLSSSPMIIVMCDVKQWFAKRRRQVDTFQKCIGMTPYLHKEIFRCQRRNQSLNCTTSFFLQQCLIWKMQEIFLKQNYQLKSQTESIFLTLKSTLQFITMSNSTKNFIPTLLLKQHWKIVALQP